MEELNESDLPNGWKAFRNGVRIMCAIELVIIIIITSGNTNTARSALPIIFNYYVSKSYIKHCIDKGKKISNPLLFSLMVSGAVFAMQIILGIALYISYPDLVK